MENLKLIKPTMDLEEQVFEMVQEFYEDGSTPYWSSWLKRYLHDYIWWLDYLKNNESEDTIIDKRYVPGVQYEYILVREPDNEVIWFINTRLKLDEWLLQYWWHIGYSIRPKERKKHYATWELFAVLKIYDDLWIEKVLLTCDKVNIWSVKTIQNCGWILENEIIDSTDWELIQRYWINVKEWIEKWKIFFNNCGFKIEIM